MSGTVAGGFLLKDTAVVAIRGKNLEESPVPRAGFDVYQAIRTRAQRKDPDGNNHEGEPGYRWRGDVRIIFIDLWPAGQEILEGVPREAAHTAVMQWLLRSGNLVNLERGLSQEAASSESRLSLWWIPREFKGDLPDSDQAPDEPEQEENEEPAAEEGEEHEAASPALANACAEPGCPRTFNHGTTRAHHEKTAHPESPYRVFKCPTKFCTESFYRLAGALHHISTVHEVKQGSSAFVVTRAQIQHNAETALEALRRASPAPAADRAGPPEPTQFPAAAPQVIFAAPGEPPAPAPAPPRQVPAPAVPVPPAASPPDDSGSASSHAHQALVILGNMLRERDRLLAENKLLHGELASLREQLARSKNNENIRTQLEAMLASLK